MNRKLLVWMVMIGCLTVFVVRAEETNRLKTAVSIGYTLTDGNSKTMQANGSIVTEGEKEGLGSVRVGIEANYGASTVNSQRETTVYNADAFVNVKKTISPHTFGYLVSSVLYDDIADVDYRVTVGPGVGVYLVKSDKTSLSVEAGPSYVWQQVARVRDDYIAVRAAERFDQKLGTAKIWQSAEYLPKADDFGDYFINGELGAEAAMTTRVNLKIVLQDKYNSTPADDLKKNDMTLVAGISIKL
jgi:putative salt-induced outer membrane protein YdiY